MAIVHGDWTIERDTGDIRYTGGDHGASPSYATVIQFHRWLQDLADDAIATAANDDELDITNTDPSRRSTDNIITLINGYNIDDVAQEHLFDGSIIQDEGDTIYDGIVNFGNSSVQIQVLQDGTILTDDWWNQAGIGLNPDSGAGISHRFMVKTRINGIDIDGRRLIGTSRTFENTYSEFKINGTSRGNNVLALSDSDDLNNETIEATVSGWTNITNTEGLNLIDVDDNGTPEEYYSQWTDNGTPDRAQNDFYERMKWLTRDTSVSTIHGISGEDFRGITHSLAWDLETGGITVATNDILAWGTAIAYTNEGGAGAPFVEGDYLHETTAIPTWKGRVLAVDDDGVAGTLIVHITFGTVNDTDLFTTVRGGSEATADVSGTPTVVTGGGTLLALAVDDDGAAGNLYFQILKGTSPPDDGLVYQDDDATDYITVAGTPEDKAVSTPFCGVSTGSNIIGAYGFALGVTDLDDSDTLTALDGLTYSRPNLVTNSVGGLTFAGDVDRVIVAPWDGTTVDSNDDPAIDKGQLLVSTALVADNITSVIVKTGTETAIPTDTPNAGYIRVIDNNGYERHLHYSSWTGTTFTIDTTDGNEDFGTVGAAIDNQVWIAYLDQDATAGTHSYQATYDVARDLVVVVRNGGSDPIKQFIAEWSFGSSNQTLNAIRTTDL